MSLEDSLQIYSTPMSYAYTLKRSARWFGFFTVLSLAAAAGMWYYVDRNADPGQQVLGEQVGGLSLFAAETRLVKTAADPTVYALIGTKKYPIRNEEVFRSYGRAFSAVQVVLPAELERYQLVRLAKNKDNGRVYFLDWGRGLKKYHPTPQHFSAYGGNKWGDVVTLSAQDLAFWPEVMLLKTADSPSVYAIVGDQKALIPDENSFNNAGFTWTRLATVSAADLNAYRTTDFTQDFARQARGDVSGKGTDPVVQVPDANATGQLIVTLAAASPESQVLAYRTARNAVAALTLRADGGKASVTGLTVTKDGILADTAVTRLELADANGVVLGTAVWRGAKTWFFDFSSNPVMIPRGGTRSVTLFADFGAGTDPNLTVRFGIAEGSAITAGGGVSGVFPAWGAMHRLTGADDLIGGVRIVEQSVSATERTANIGAVKEEFARLDVSETSGNEDIEITRLAFTNAGSADGDDLDFLTLYVDGRARATVREMDGRQVIFNLDKPLGIRAGRKVTLALKGDVVAGENATAKFVIVEAGDIAVRGTKEKLYLVPQADRWPVGQGASDAANRVTFQREGIGLFGVKLKDAAKEIYRATDDVVLAEFELRNLNQELYLQSARLQLERFNDAPPLVGDVRIVVARGSEEIGQVSGARLTAEGFDIPLNNHAVGRNQTLKLQVIGDVPDTAVSNNAYRFTLARLAYKIGAENREYAHERPAIGQLMRVYAPQLAVAVGTIAKPSVAAGTDGVVLGSFEFTAGPDERLTITDLSLSLAPGSDDVTFTRGFEDVALYVGSRRVGKVITQPNARAYDFTGISVGISAGRATTVQLRADTEVIAQGTFSVRVDGVTAQGGHSKAPVITTGVGAVSPSVTIVGGTAGADKVDE